MIVDGVKVRYDDPPPSFHAATGMPISSRASTSSSTTAHDNNLLLPSNRTSPTLPPMANEENPFLNPSESTLYSGSAPSTPPTAHTPTAKSKQRAPPDVPYRNREASSSTAGLIRGSISSREYPNGPSNPSNRDLEAQHQPSEKATAGVKKNASNSPFRAMTLGLLMLCTVSFWIAGYFVLAMAMVVNAMGMFLTGLGNAIKSPHDWVLRKYQVEE
ncbi:hypothetical protein CC1G_05969 [Coprinopsis cinerea okayama7|uniref:Uncharacterized protein n=1 Tax=Coprinopsis cinerea (strain Okayama-7 / 130 / ATCC MYA-4618 / FGSC 9003) TaxID=240176 RepID=A8N4J1_COPC7|nr:hypothetical protein CC1G_05969 [Coprinopsis cinerea okayama7\|eukprot:XP_001829760.1 hypothetical protein CC1G_05969 [Coprinopsis cinerea okayama7\